MMDLKARRTDLSSGLLLSFLTVGAGEQPIPSLPAEGEPWLELRSGHFTFISQVDESETRRIAANLETFRRALPRVAPQMEPRSNKPTLVFVFRDEASFAPYKSTPLEKGSEKVTGLFLAGGDTDYIRLKAGLPGDPYGVVYHEFVHQVAAERFVSLPLWLDEGLAEYYSTFSCEKSRVTVGRPVAGHLAWLSDHPPLPLRELFNADEDVPPDLSTGFYATSWLLVHYLIHDDPRRPQRLPGFLADLQAAKPEAQSHIAAFGLDYRELETALRRYVREDNYSSSSWTLEGASVPVSDPVEPVSRNELLYHLGELLAHAGPERHDAAEAHLMAAAALDPDDPGARAALAELRYQQERYEEAATLFLQAVDRGANDPVTLFRAAKALMPRAPAGISKIEKLPDASMQRVRELLRRGLEQAPDSADALADLGRTYLLTDVDPTPGIAAFEKAMALLPSDPDIPWNLMQLYLRQGDRARAAAVIEGPMSRLLPASEVQAAREHLLRFDLRVAAASVEEAEIEAYYHVVDLADRGDFAGAIDALTELAESCNEPPRCEQFTQLLVTMKETQHRQRR